MVDVETSFVTRFADTALCRLKPYDCECMSAQSVPMVRPWADCTLAALIALSARRGADSGLCGFGDLWQEHRSASLRRCTQEGGRGLRLSCCHRAPVRPIGIPADPVSGGHGVFSAPILPEYRREGARCVRKYEQIAHLRVYRGPERPAAQGAGVPHAGRGAASRVRAGSEAGHPARAGALKGRSAPGVARRDSETVRAGAVQGAKTAALPAFASSRDCASAAGAARMDPLQ